MTLFKETIFFYLLTFSIAGLHFLCIFVYFQSLSLNFATKRRVYFQRLSLLKHLNQSLNEFDLCGRVYLHILVL